MELFSHNILLNTLLRFQCRLGHDVPQRLSWRCEMCVLCPLGVCVCVFVMESPETEHRVASGTRPLTEEERASKY